MPSVYYTDTIDTDIATLGAQLLPLECVGTWLVKSLLPRAQIWTYGPTAKQKSHSLMLKNTGQAEIFAFCFDASHDSGNLRPRDGCHGCQNSDILTALCRKVSPVLVLLGNATSVTWRWLQKLMFFFPKENLQSLFRPRKIDRLGETGRVKTTPHRISTEFLLCDFDFTCKKKLRKKSVYWTTENNQQREREKSVFWVHLILSQNSRLEIQRRKKTESAAFVPEASVVVQHCLVTPSDELTLRGGNKWIVQTMIVLTFGILGMIFCYPLWCWLFPSVVSSRSVCSMFHVPSANTVHHRKLVLFLQLWVHAFVRKMKQKPSTENNKRPQSFQGQ